MLKGMTSKILYISLYFSNKNLFFIIHYYIYKYQIAIILKFVYTNYFNIFIIKFF